MKFEQISERFLNKVLVFRHKRKNGTILEWTRLKFLAIRVVEN